MNRPKQHRHLLSLTALLLVVAPSHAAFAQSDDAGDSQSGSGYTVNEDHSQQSAPSGGGTVSSDSPSKLSQANDVPVRLARISLVRGDVSYRTDETSAWSTASVHLPVRQGTQIWVGPNGRAEIQLDDGSYLRIARDSVVTLKTLYSDAEGAFTELEVHDGLIFLRLKHDKSVYQVNLPFASVKASGPARLRIGAGTTLDVAVHQGKALVESGQETKELEEGRFMNLRDVNSPLESRRLPSADGWDTWNLERDREIDGLANSDSQRYLPSNIAIVSDDLDHYGHWSSDPTYGHVWVPDCATGEWRPYNDGHWVWVSPFGWTWVANEPWGWAPYHYGTWMVLRGRWSWCPGPQYQCWTPAAVSFCTYSNNVYWVPLAPCEVRYPSYRVAVGYRNWGVYFAIGQAGCYYREGNYFTHRPWGANYVNHATYVTNNYYINNHTTTVRNNYIPYNAQNANGATGTPTNGFGGNGIYQRVPRSLASVFGRGDVAAQPSIQGSPIAGPVGVGSAAITLNQRAVSGQPRAAALQRTIYRAPVPAQIARTAQSYRVDSANAANRLNRAIPPQDTVRAQGRSEGTVSSVLTRRQPVASQPARANSGNQDAVNSDRINNRRANSDRVDNDRASTRVQPEVRRTAPAVSNDDSSSPAARAQRARARLSDPSSTPPARSPQIERGSSNDRTQQRDNPATTPRARQQEVPTPQRAQPRTDPAPRETRQPRTESQPIPRYDPPRREPAPQRQETPRSTPQPRQETPRVERPAPQPRQETPRVERPAPQRAEPRQESRPAPQPRQDPPRRDNDEKRHRG